LRLLMSEAACRRGPPLQRNQEAINDYPVFAARQAAPPARCTDFALPASSMRRCEAVETHLDFGIDHLFDELPAQPLIIRKSQRGLHRKGAQAIRIKETLT
jgi:hypothetical protein